MRRWIPLLSMLMVAHATCFAHGFNDDEASLVERNETIESAVKGLISFAEEDGAWPYEGVYRVQREIPVGYRVGGTAIVCEALMYAAATDDGAAQTAIRGGVAIILKDLEHPLMEPSTRNTYDVRVWGHIYALDLFCRLKRDGRFEELHASLDPWIETLTETLLTEQLDDGGWNYASRRAHAAFVTAPAVQALLWANAEGMSIDQDVFDKAQKALLESRTEEGAYTYSGPSSRRPTEWPGAIARAAACETTLTLLGHPRQDEIETAVEMFHEHWDELEKRRQKTGTHVGPYAIAPYYFYYGHRYVAQAIRFLPESERAAAQQKFEDVLLKTKEEDDTWNDRVFDRSKAYGTAMALLALAPGRVSLPPVLDGK